MIRALLLSLPAIVLYPWVPELALIVAGAGLMWLALDWMAGNA